MFKGMYSTIFKLNLGQVLIPITTIIYSIKNTRIWTFNNKLFNALTPEIFADNTNLQNCLRRQTNSTDL